MHNLPELPPPHCPESNPDQIWFGRGPQTNGLATKSHSCITVFAWACNAHAELAITAHKSEIRADLTPEHMRLLAATLIQAADHVDANTALRDAKRAELLATTYRPVTA